MEDRDVTICDPAESLCSGFRSQMTFSNSRTKFTRYHAFFFASDGVKLSERGGDMEHIFAPWRMTYIKKAEPTNGCFLCEYPKEERDSEHMIVARGRHCFVICNAYPYNPGHLMVAPYRHTADYAHLPVEEAMDIHSHVARALECLQRAMNPQGYNIGINLGKVSGAGLDEHVHVHIVPRWNGDTNFMPVFSDVRVVAEALEETYRRLCDSWR